MFLSNLLLSQTRCKTVHFFLASEILGFVCQIYETGLQSLPILLFVRKVDIKVKNRLQNYSLESSLHKDVVHLLKFIASGEKN